MNYKLLISEKAHNDIESIYNFISKDGITMAKKQISIIYSSIERLELFPNIGSNLSTYTVDQNKYKFLSVNKTYIIFYKIVDDKVRILRVFRKEQDYLCQLGIE